MQFNIGSFDGGGGLGVTSDTIRCRPASNDDEHMSLIVVEVA